MVLMLIPLGHLIILFQWEKNLDLIWFLFLLRKLCVAATFDVYNVSKKSWTECMVLWFQELENEDT